MNHVLLFENDFITTNTIRLEGRRAEHLFKILKVVPGQKIRVGKVRGPAGFATIKNISSANEGTVIDLEVLSFDQSIPTPSLSLIFAMPRPQTLKKIIEGACTYGVREIFLIESEKGEKSYFQSPMLTQEDWKEHAVLGLEQGRQTWLPDVFVFEKFWEFKKAFAKRTEAETRIVLDGEAQESLRTTIHSSSKMIAAIGPESGWTEKEMSQWQEMDFRLISLGPTIWRVEQALCAFLGQLSLV